MIHVAASQQSQHGEGSAGVGQETDCRPAGCQEELEQGEHGESLTPSPSLSLSTFLPLSCLHNTPATVF